MGSGLTTAGRHSLTGTTRGGTRQAAEQGADLGVAPRATSRPGTRPLYAADPGGHRSGREIAGQVEITTKLPGASLRASAAYHPGRVIGIGHQMQHRQQQRRHRPGQIQRLRRPGEHSRRVAQVGLGA